MAVDVDHVRYRTSYLGKQKWSELHGVSVSEERPGMVDVRKALAAPGGTPGALTE